MSKLRASLAIVVLGVLFVLQPMAFASPPDQSWLGGFFDDDDFDDVILLITGCCPATVSAVTREATPTFVVVCTLLESQPLSAPAPLFRSHDTRAPPLAA